MNSKKLNIIFAGTPEISEKVLQDLIDSRHNVISALTQPDRPSGRGKKLKPSPVKLLAEQNHIPVLQPISFKKNPEIITQLETLNADIMVVVAYGIILPQSVLDIPKHGCLNIHVSLLPKYRGAAPIQRALLAGDKVTGITIMQMDKGLDTGDILHTLSYDIANDNTSGSLHDALANISGKTVLKTLDDICLGALHPQKQSTESTYAKKLTKEEAKIDWHQTAETIERNIRGYNPWPVAHMTIEGQIVKVWAASIKDKCLAEPGTILAISKAGIEVATRTQILCLTTLQFPAKKAMHVRDILNGKDLRHLVGQKLTS
jgi:methionyl-tRNA formyltransferase